MRYEFKHPFFFLHKQAPGTKHDSSSTSADTPRKVSQHHFVVTTQERESGERETGGIHTLAIAE